MQIRKIDSIYIDYPNTLNANLYKIRLFLQITVVLVESCVGGKLMMAT